MTGRKWEELRGKFELASREKIDNYPAGETKVLEVLRHPEALVTDGTELDEFLLDLQSEQEIMEMLGKLSVLCGREVGQDEYIWELAKDANIKK